MTTLSSSTSFSMASTAAMRATGAEMNGWFSTVGLVQTADTGQVNWTTVNLPAGANVAIGYEIWRFADSSIYFKLEWETNSTNTNSPAFRLTVGTGSDGAGAITGQTSSRTLLTVNSTIGSTSTAYPTYMCRTADFFGMVWKVGGNSSMPSACGFAIEKMVDSSGAVDSTGFVVSRMGGATTGLQSKQAVRTASVAQTFADSTSFCAVPASVASSTNSAGNKQVFLHAFPSPDVKLSNFMASYVASEAAQSTTLSTTLVGSTAHTYMALTNAMGTGNSSSAAVTWGTMMLWE